jgi:hypothetical protein
MRFVLGIATILGISGVIMSFGLFYLGEQVFHLDRAVIQTLMYLKLSVAGHLGSGFEAKTARTKQSSACAPTLGDSLS